MKTNILRWGIAVAAATSLLSGCLKSSDNTTQPPLKAYLSIMHLAPTAPTLDVFFNETKVSNTPFTAGTVTLGYNAIDKGVFSIKFKKVTTDSVVAEVAPSQYDSLNYYTIFIHNLQVNGPAHATRIKDDFSDLSQDPSRPYYRFYHASPNTGAVDLYMDNVKVQSSRMQADNTGFDALNKFLGTTTGIHTFEVKLAGTDTVIATLGNVDLSRGNAYTIYLKGLDGGSGPNLLTIGILRAS